MRGSPHQWMHITCLGRLISATNPRLLGGFGQKNGLYFETGLRFGRGSVH